MRRKKEKSVCIVLLPHYLVLSAYVPLPPFPVASSFSSLYLYFLLLLSSTSEAIPYALLAALLLVLHVGPIFCLIFRSSGSCIPLIHKNQESMFRGRAAGSAGLLWRNYRVRHTRLCVFLEALLAYVFMPYGHGVKLPRSSVV